MCSENLVAASVSPVEEDKLGSGSCYSVLGDSGQQPHRGRSHRPEAAGSSRKRENCEPWSEAGSPLMVSVPGVLSWT